ncbi:MULTISPECIES: hypothetical protein [unclassified Caballeronia]|uniref:hypothetical protein n=1 Tax=unclassified Caballeronia TaxID=2646786 RepID=UPI001F15F46E|nr:MULTISPECIES: hypothetical protein [unclassified Caballeronia]MCE4547410.1 hypothetical protein [Caballeronia sp. PC1]MCE4575394.1 hypothetical protein [Caballeronia sp. CLC5]
MVPRPKISDVEVDFQTLVSLKKAPQGNQFLGWWTWRLIGYEYPSLVSLETTGYGPQKPGPNIPTDYVRGHKTIEQARVWTCEEYRRLAVPVYTADTMRKAFDALEKENEALRAVLRTAASDAAALSAKVNALGSQLDALRADVPGAKSAVAASGARRGQASPARQ